MIREKLRGLRGCRDDILCGAMAALAGLSLCVRNDRLAVTARPDHKLLSRLGAFLWRLDAAIDAPSYATLLAVALLFLAFRRLVGGLRRRDLRWMLPVSAAAALMLLLADSYYRDYTWDSVFGNTTMRVLSLIKGMGLTALILFPLALLDRLVLKRLEGGLPAPRWRPILLRALVLLALWLPYMLIMYPGSTNPDTTDQIAQITGNVERSWTARSVVLVNPDVILNNHHPVFYTAILAVFVRLGRLLGSSRLGMFAYSALQCAALAFTLSCQAAFIERRCASRRVNLLVLLFFGLNPLFPLWGMTVMKDMPYAMLTWWVIALLWRQLRPRPATGKGEMALFGFVLLLWMLLRNNGFYILLLIVPCACVYFRRHRRRLILLLDALLIPMILFQGGVQTVLFSVLDITPGSPREALSVPFMQTARMLEHHADELTYGEQELILSLFNTPNHSLDDIVARYKKQPDHADAVKNAFNKYAGDAALREYFSLWARCLVRHPLVYLQAFLALNHGWFGENSRHEIVYYDGNVKTKIQRVLPGYVTPRRLKPFRQMLNSLVGILSKIPLTAWAFKTSFFTWATLLSLLFMLRRRRKRALMAMTPLFFNYLVCFFGPLAYMRYALPAVVCLPTLLALAFSEK